MLVIFCQSPFDRKAPDEMYADEAAAATKIGLGIRIIDFETLVGGGAERAVRGVPESSGRLHAVYRGWMMRPEIYEELFTALSRRGIYLINEPAQYKHCHHLPEWLDKLRNVTPNTSVLPLNLGEEPSLAQLKECLNQFGDHAVIVKDFVKSEKHHWDEACYIPNAADTPNALRIAQNFLRLRGSDLEGGLVFREFVKFRKIGVHPKSRMPLTEEFRAFVLDGKIVHLIYYWDEVEYPESAPNLDWLIPHIATIQSRFFTVDFARLESGEWLIVELGDGQVSGLTETSELQAFYQSLSSANNGPF